MSASHFDNSSLQWQTLFESWTATWTLTYTPDIHMYAFTIGSERSLEMIVTESLYQRWRRGFPVRIWPRGEGNVEYVVIILCIIYILCTFYIDIFMFYVWFNYYDHTYVLCMFMYVFMLYVCLQLWSHFVICMIIFMFYVYFMYVFNYVIHVLYMFYMFSIMFLLTLSLVHARMRRWRPTPMVPRPNPQRHRPPNQMRSHRKFPSLFLYHNQPRWVQTITVNWLGKY